MTPDEARVIAAKWISYPHVALTRLAQTGDIDDVDELVSDIAGEIKWAIGLGYTKEDVGELVKLLEYVVMET